MKPIKITFPAFFILLLISSSQQQLLNLLFVCDPNNRPTYCDQGIKPVCAYTPNCTEPTCRYTAGNNCTACLDPTIEYYIRGVCQDEQAPIESFCNHIDEPNSNEGARLLTSPEATVCLTYSGCYGDDCYQPAVSDDYACRDPNVVSYISKACVYIKRPQKIVCDINNRPKTCGIRTEHVCAFFRLGLGTPRTLPSPCYACLDEEVEYYIPGICLEDMKQNKHFCDIYNFVPPCAPPIANYYNPVCVFKRNCTEEPCSYTLNYACGACGSGIGVDYYVDGACKRFCDSKFICSEEPGPVCAFNFGCAGENCGKTMDSGCTACSDAEIEYYTGGECRKSGFTMIP